MLATSLEKVRKRVADKRFFPHACRKMSVYAVVVVAVDDDVVVVLVLVDFVTLDLNGLAFK
jgi:hypothetical protein